MNIVVEAAGPCRKKLRIEVPADKVDTEYQSVLTAYASAARIPGFRPGRAPRELVNRRFGREIVQEVKDRLIPTSYRAALDQEKISPVAVLELKDVEIAAGRPFSFEVTLDVPPDFKLPAYRGLTLQRKPVEVKDEDLDQTLQHLRDSSARFEEASQRAIQKGDLVQVDYDGVCDGKPIAGLAPDAKGLGEGKDFWVQVDENAFLPEFGTALVGQQAGQSAQVLVDFPADFKPAAVAGRKATYFVKIKAVREKKLPELDADFCKQFGAESAEELRARIREDLAQVAEERETKRLKSEIVRRLLEATSMELPGSVVAEETRQTVYNLVRENTSRGVSEAALEDKKEELLNAAGRSAEEKVKANYIIHRIADEEKIEPSEEEVTARLESMARAYGAPVDQIRAAMEKNNRLDSLREQVRFNKTVEFLLKQAIVNA